MNMSNDDMGIETLAYCLYPQQPAWLGADTLQITP